MPSLVCFIREGPDEIYFANRLHEAFGVDLAIVAEARRTFHLLASKARSSGLSGTRDAVRERIGELRRKGQKSTDYDRWFGDRWHELHTKIPVLRTASINDAAVLERVATLDSVDLAVHADSIVREDLLRVCRVALNLHWGLSPYYRGTRCTEWALLNWDVGNVGVTVHELAAEIDGGKIVGQARAVVSSEDTVSSINAQLTVLGTEIMIDALRILRDGGDLQWTPQDLARGHLTRKRQWSGHLSRHVVRLQRRGLGPMIASPSRGELPIIRLHQPMGKGDIDSTDHEPRHLRK